MGEVKLSVRLVWGGKMKCETSVGKVKLSVR